MERYLTRIRKVLFLLVVSHAAAAVAWNHIKILTVYLHLERKYKLEYAIFLVEIIHNTAK